MDGPVLIRYSDEKTKKGTRMLTPSSHRSKIFTLIDQERERLDRELCLIASENYAPENVLQATGSILTNKYAEGYPGKRYYAGCQYVDTIEQYAIENCNQLFGSEYCNVQPHAGSQANIAAYFAVLQPGDTILGMSLDQGGHLTHGHAVNFSGIFYKSVSYGVDPVTECIDYNVLHELARLHRPKLIVVGASAYSRIIDFARCAAIAQDVGALLMADIAHIAGLIAAGVHPTPVGHADIITSTTHKTLRGPRGGIIMAKKEHADRIDRAIMPGTQGGPFMHVIAAKAVAFENALQPEFAVYQRQVIENARVLAQLFVDLGYRVVSGGTDNHLFIIDLRSKNITGLQAQRALEQAGIIVSRSTIPNDPQKPWITSGIRLGTPAITTRGMRTEHMHHIAHSIDHIITHYTNEQMLARSKHEIMHLMQQFPLYTNMPMQHAPLEINIMV